MNGQPTSNKDSRRLLDLSSSSKYLGTRKKDWEIRPQVEYSICVTVVWIMGPSSGDKRLSTDMLNYCFMKIENVNFNKSDKCQWNILYR